MMHGSKPSLSKKGFLVGAAIGSGSTALAAERGGADFLLAINAGRIRAMGAPSIACMLPIFDSDALTIPFAVRELLPQCTVPVLIGRNVWGRDFSPFKIAEEVERQGFDGITNFPSSLHYPKSLRGILSHAGRGIEAEVSMLRAAKDRGLMVMFYCSNRIQARLAADAGLDLICLNLGWNVGGAIGHRRRASLEEVAMTAREIGRLVKRINPSSRFLLEGGPIETAEDLERVTRLEPIDGYVGGSTFERMPLEASIADQIARFRQSGGAKGSDDPPTARLISWGRARGAIGHSKALLHFLRTLRPLEDDPSPVLLCIERGISDSWILSSLARDTGAASSIVTIDVEGEEYPARARTLLFGHRDTVDRRPPGLADPNIQLIVIRAAEKLAPATQRRLARALTDRSFRAPGSWRKLPVLPRVVLASETSMSETRDLLGIGYEQVLLAALGKGVVRMPPLRERTEDIFSLEPAIGAVDRDTMTAAAEQRLLSHTWPGNESELTRIAFQLGLRTSPGPITEEEVDTLLKQETTPKGLSVGSEKDRIVDALWRNGFNRTKTATALGMSRKTLYNKIKRFDLGG